MIVPKVLALDPGLTTGFAIVQGSTIVKHGNIFWIEDDPDYKYIFEQLKLECDVVVAEIVLTPHTKLGFQLRKITQLIQEIFPDAEWVLSGTWKNTAVYAMKLPNGISRHEKDAIRIATWYIKRKNLCQGSSSPSKE